MPNKYYITTAIDYANAGPHIGHALEKIQADVLARARRARGEDVFFLTGTDEHGAKIARAAKEAGKEPQEFVDEIVLKWKALKETLHLSWDDFIRTTDESRHIPGAIELWKALGVSGDLYKKKYSGLYCVGHEAFITEKELVDGKCPDHGKAPELLEEENWFFKLSKYGETIAAKIELDELKIVPETRKREILSFIKSGLTDVSFSRPKNQVSWGIPVPDDPEQTMYVWCDALANYLTGAGYGREETHDSRLTTHDFSYWWPADAHVIGKDILRFHAAIWPGMLVSAGLPLPKSIIVHGFLRVEGKKISKTLGNVIDPNEIVKTYGTDALRYYLLREAASGDDGDFSEEKLRERYNGDLANGLGNFAARVLALAENEDLSAADLPPEFDKKIRETRIAVNKKIDAFKLHEALAAIWELVAFGDGYVNEKKAWTLEGEARGAAIYPLVVLLDNIGALLAPFLPGTAERIKSSIRWEGDRLTIKKSGVLFPRLRSCCGEQARLG